jgi:hypothetical protein
LKTSGSTTTDTLALALTNNGTDKVTFNISSGAGSPFTGSITESWFIPTGFSDLTAVSFAYSYGTLSTDGYSLGSSPFTRAIPTGVGPITAGTTLQLAVAWSYKKTDGTLTSTPLQKLCIAYRIPSEPNTTKFCNVVGQAVNTKNPNACD